MILLGIYLLGALLMYLVPPFFGLDFNGEKFPPAPLAALVWPLTLVGFAVYFVVSFILGFLENARVAILKKYLSKRKI